VPGLHLRIREGGSRSVVIQWRQGAGQRRATVGKVGVLSLDNARKKARKMPVGIDDGNDPATARRRLAPPARSSSCRSPGTIWRSA
jgi:hypothetical protein